MYNFHKMKKYLLSFGIIIPLFFSCTTKKAEISGRVVNAEKKLLGLTGNSVPLRIYDTVTLKADGKFRFKYEFKNDLPVFLVLTAEKKHLANLLVGKGEKIKFESDYDNPGQYTVGGSEGSALLKELNDKALKVTASYDSLVAVSEKAENAPEYDEILKNINYQAAVLFTGYKQDLIRFIVTNSKSLASYSAMYQVLPNGFSMFGKESDMMYFKILADSLETKYPKSSYVRKLRDDYKKIVNAVNFQELLDNASEISSIPDVALPDVTGKERKLSDLNGKVFLLDFWISQDKTLLMNNMETKEIYDKYKSKGFEIYQISLDTDRQQWLTAVANQGLEWISVCDFKGAGSVPVSVYNIKKVPSNFLIDKSGDIIAKDVYGKDLEQNIIRAFSAK